MLLRYKAGGMILASMGHWCELIKVKASEEQLLKVMEAEYGSEMKKSFFNTLQNYRGQERFDFIESNAQRMVQESTPGMNFKRKMKFMS